MQYAAGIIEAYQGEMPLSAFLKQYFAQYKKFGSKDRKHIGHLCYCYYRLGSALPGLPVTGRIKAALFLCSDILTDWQPLFTEHWISRHTPDLESRLQFLEQEMQLDVTAIFPFTQDLSKAIEQPPFIRSHLVQPDLYLRLRPRREAQVLHNLRAHDVPFRSISPTCIALPNNTRLEGIVQIDKEAVVQDRSSQQVAGLLQQVSFDNTTRRAQVWDCCAASGGKSLLAYDTLKHIYLNVSDVRPSIIQNLKKRFAAAGIHDYSAFVKDLSIEPNAHSKEEESFEWPLYDLILCDVPCSGSGTWSRTPEQLYFFTPEKIRYYQQLQRRILTQAVRQLKKGGYFLYITCSVFEAENEANVAFATEKLQLQQIDAQLLRGYDHKADTLFAALFTT